MHRSGRAERRPGRGPCSDRGAEMAGDVGRGGAGGNAIPAAAISRPNATSGLGPVRGISTMLEIWAKSISIAMAGTNANPVTTGEYPRTVCR